MTFGWLMREHILACRCTCVLHQYLTLQSIVSITNEDVLLDSLSPLNQGLLFAGCACAAGLECEDW